jgi:hypothetical protein
VGLVPASVVRLERTLAHESLRWRGWEQSADRVGRRVVTSWPGVLACQLAPRPHAHGRGHAAPVDTGPTDQRYAGGALRVNLSTRVAAATGRAARCWAARRRPNRVRTGHGRTLGRRAVGDTPEPVQGMRQPVENWLIHRLSGC